MTEFEQYANNHKAHPHCDGCGGCLLDQRVNVIGLRPVYCIGCMRRISERAPLGAALPWEDGTAAVLFSEEAIEIVAKRELARLALRGGGGTEDRT